MKPTSSPFRRMLRGLIRDPLFWIFFIVGLSLLLIKIFERMPFLEVSKIYRIF